MYAGLGTKISPWLAQAKTMQWVNRTVGGLFMLLGSALALSTWLSKKT